MIISTTMYIIYIFTTINEDIWKSGKKDGIPIKMGKRRKQLTEFCRQDQSDEIFIEPLSVCLKLSQLREGRISHVC